MARVVLEHLTKEFTEPKGQCTRALKDASLTVADGEFLVLVGPSGCGKTTTLRLIAGLETPTAGTISIADQVVNTVPAKERDIAMVFQNPALYPHMSAYENLAFGLTLRNCPRSEIDRRVRAAAELLHLTDCLERKPMLLSGGQRQRVALGRAIVRQPKVFLFDEPLSNLDAPMRAQLRLELAKLHHRLGATMIYVTHDQTEAMTLGDRVAVMREGVIQQVADPVSLYRHPANMFVAGFIGSPPMNFFRGTVARRGNVFYFQGEPVPSAAESSGLALPLEGSLAVRVSSYAGKQVILGLRPEHISIHANLPESPSEPAAAATVEMIEPLGAETLVYLTSGKQSFVARVPATDRVSVNQKVSVAFELSHAQCFDPATEKAIG